MDTVAIVALVGEQCLYLFKSGLVSLFLDHQVGEVCSQLTHFPLDLLKLRTCTPLLFVDEFTNIVNLCLDVFLLLFAHLWITFCEALIKESNCNVLCLLNFSLEHFYKLLLVHLKFHKKVAWCFDLVVELLTRALIEVDGLSELFAEGNKLMHIHVDCLDLKADCLLVVVHFMEGADCFIDALI